MQAYCAMKTIPVSTGHGYTVSIGSDILHNCGSMIKADIPPCRAAIITDSIVGPLYVSTVEKSLLLEGFTASIFTFPAGEPFKTMETLSSALEFMAQEQMTRTDCIIALGGGVVGDIGGFAAGCFLRGIPYVYLPTTLLAAVDSSIGGKTAVNLSAGKNLAGLFYSPSAVLCDTGCLHTLPKEAFLSGLAEAIKMGILKGEALFSILERENPEDAVEDIISECVAYKARIVQADEYEKGLRKTLNLGHTIGHAIETCSGYTIPHGHAVSTGIAMITRAAAAMGWCHGEDARRITGLLAKKGLPTQTEFSTEALMQAALRDKKRAGGYITLVVPEKIGSCKLQDIPLSGLPSIIDAGRRHLT